MNNTFDTTGFETTATASTQPANSTTFVANTQLADTPPQVHFTANPPDRPQFDPLPVDTTYKCTVDKLDVQLDKYGRWEIFAQFKIADGPFSRRRIFKHCKLNGTKNDAAMQRAALRFLTHLAPASNDGTFPPNLAALNAAVAIAYTYTAGKYYAVRLSQSGKYTNVDIMGVCECP